MGLFVLYPSHGESSSCRGAHLESHHEYLQRAYSEMLRDVNQDLFGDNTIPWTLTFKGREYKILEYLGRGIEGLAVRVEDSSGKRSIMKVFVSNHTSLIRQMWDYYRMNRVETHPYTVIGVDYRQRIFQFADIRGIPMNRINYYLTKVNAPESVRNAVYSQVALVGYRHYDQNTIYDIDRGVFVSIDPH